MSELTKLHAQDNNITDLTPLARLTKLYSLDIANNAIVDVTPIREFVQMELLWISSNEIEDISALDRLTALQMLSARNNHIGDISVLSHMPNLDSLDLEYNEISDISYLTDLVQLRTLDLDINRVRDLAPLANLPLLRTVELHSNPIRDIQALVNNPGIGAGDTVALQWTPLSQVSLCSHVPALTGRGVSVTFTGTCGADADGDDLADAYEAISNTSPTNPDTDGDGLNDGDERSLGTNPKDSDSDNDGMLDGTEVGAGTDPLDNTSVLSDVYVDGASGSDDTGVGTQSAPWATVAHAVDAVTGTMENTVSIHIARGVYTHLNATGGALWLDSHEHLLGGYEAAGWTRDADANETVLDASIAINGSPAPNVIVLDGVSDVLLDGLTVTGAYAPEQGAEGSAGILGIDLDATTFINNCRVVRNRGSILGSGGIRLFGSSPVITNSTIANNFAYGSGGGILLTGAPSHLIMDRCAISGNRGFGGGIVVGEGATVAITNSLINGNNAGSWGGGGLAFGGEAGSVIANTTIAHNNADWNSGGGIEVHSGMPLFVNCIFAGNRDYAILDYTPTTGLVLRNCLFNGNPEGDYRRFESITRNGAAAINTLAGASGNVDGDPAFVISQGVWTQAHTYSAATGRTTLVDAQASFTPGALAGTYLALFPSSPDVQLVVHSNTATTIEVVGQVSNSIGVGSAYSVIDYHLEPGSAAIDMGIDTSAPEDGGVLTDFDGVARGFDGDGLGAATADGSDYDIGAYESNTPVDSITVLAPNGGETFTRGTPAEIRWSSVGNVGTSVKILIRRGTYVGTLFGGTPNDGVHTWNIPSNYAIASGYTLEVVSVANPAISDASDAGFSIAAPTGPAGTLTVTSPNGGESYLQGATVPIAWTSTGSPGANVDILARRGAASVVLVSATSNDGAFNWIVPTDQAPGTDYVIEVRSSTTPTITDSSNAPFSISAPPTLLLSAPNGGESYLQGATVPIAWTSTGAVGTIVQLLAHGAGQTFSIDAAATNDGAYDWMIPAGQPAGTDYTIEVRALSNPAINDASNAPFTIQAPLPADSVTVLSPNGGESLLRGAPFQIRWSTTGNVGTSVKVVIRRGAYASTLFGGTPNDGVQTWNIPATYPVASGYSIEISSVANPAIKDTSYGTFAIGDTAPAASITVTAPNGGESYLQGGTLPITWTSTGEVGASVEILAHGAGQTFNLAASTANDGAFDWSIPAGQPTGTNYTIQVRSLANPAITDSSNSTFGINAAPPAASLTVTAPNGGESYLQGGTLPITWTSTGAVGTIVQIFAHGAGQSFTVDAGTTNDGAYDWAIPAGQLVGTNYTIEVRSLSTPAISDSSNSAFSINAAPSASSITVISPNGGETLTRGGSVELRWSSTGITGSTVKIVIRRGAYVGTLFGGTPNDGVHNWNIPSTYPTGTGFTIEISSVANPAIGDASDGSFTIATP
ncbi:MAG: leucine-rich repeat domain-containing protein [Candidatus Hydrogenedentes bacterium]|nr:leucine-rich repeat domain-containing protein [Candidatus Hydrogenedentota bacterium]